MGFRLLNKCIHVLAENMFFKTDFTHGSISRSVQLYVLLTMYVKTKRFSLGAFEI